MMNPCSLLWLIGNNWMTYFSFSSCDPRVVGHKLTYIQLVHHTVDHQCHSIKRASHHHFTTENHGYPWPTSYHHRWWRHQAPQALAQSGTSHCPHWAPSALGIGHGRENDKSRNNVRSFIPIEIYHCLFINLFIYFNMYVYMHIKNNKSIHSYIYTSLCIHTNPHICLVVNIREYSLSTPGRPHLYMGMSTLKCVEMTVFQPSSVRYLRPCAPELCRGHLGKSNSQQQG